MFLQGVVRRFYKTVKEQYFLPLGGPILRLNLIVKVNFIVPNVDNHIF